MKIAVMQPYLFPYLGYFQLLRAVDRFVVYDDVSFIKGGWINRNRILINGRAAYFNAGIVGASSFKLISEIELDPNPQWRSRMLKTIQSSYGRSPHFPVVYDFLRDIILNPTKSLSEFLTNLIINVSRVLGLSTEIVCSSGLNENRSLRGVKRVLDICRRNECEVYINAIGGQALYDKDEFREHGIELKFLKTREISYSQFGDQFVPNLSIIDLLMFNSNETLREFLSAYDLV